MYSYFGQSVSVCVCLYTHTHMDICMERDGRKGLESLNLLILSQLVLGALRS